MLHHLLQPKSKCKQHKKYKLPQLRTSKKWGISPLVAHCCISAGGDSSWCGWEASEWKFSTYEGVWRDTRYLKVFPNQWQCAICLHTEFPFQSFRLKSATISTNSNSYTRNMKNMRNEQDTRQKYLKPRQCKIWSCEIKMHPQASFYLTKFFALIAMQKLFTLGQMHPKTFFSFLSFCKSSSNQWQCQILLVCLHWITFVFQILQKSTIKPKSTNHQMWSRNIQMYR